MKPRIVNFLGLLTIAPHTRPDARGIMLLFFRRWPWLMFALSLATSNDGEWTDNGRRISGFYRSQKRKNIGFVAGRYRISLHRK